MKCGRCDRWMNLWRWTDKEGEQREYHCAFCDPRVWPTLFHDFTDENSAP